MKRKILNYIQYFIVQCIFCLSSTITMACPAGPDLMETVFKDRAFKFIYHNPETGQKEVKELQGL